MANLRTLFLAYGWLLEKSAAAIIDPIFKEFMLPAFRDTLKQYSKHLWIACGWLAELETLLAFAERLG